MVHVHEGRANNGLASRRILPDRRREHGHRHGQGVEQGRYPAQQASIAIPREHVPAMIRLFFGLMVLSKALISAPIPVSNLQLQEQTVSEVELIGFPVQLEDGSWALCNIPSLRACCLSKVQGAPTIIQCDTPLNGAVMGQLITVKGRLSGGPQLKMQETVIVKKEKDFPFLKTLMAVGGVFSGYLLWTRGTKLYRNRLAK